MACVPTEAHLDSAAVTLEDATPKMEMCLERHTDIDAERSEPLADNAGPPAEDVTGM